MWTDVHHGRRLLACICRERTRIVSGDSGTLAQSSHKCRASGVSHLTPSGHRSPAILTARPGQGAELRGIRVYFGLLPASRSGMVRTRLVWRESLCRAFRITSSSAAAAAERRSSTTPSAVSNADSWPIGADGTEWRAGPPPDALPRDVDRSPCTGRTIATLGEHNVAYPSTWYQCGQEPMRLSDSLQFMDTEHDGGARMRCSSTARVRRGRRHRDARPTSAPCYFWRQRTAARTRIRA